MTDPTPVHPPAARLRVSVVIIGDEILSGFVQDTNSGWIAGRLQTLGVPLDRVVTIPDERPAIGEALAGELARRRPRLVLTSGGIGSTPDDLTMEGVADHLGLGLVIDPDIDRRITRALERTAGEGGTVTPAHEASMRRMARVPDGAYLLSRAPGVAPGVAVDVDGGCDADAGATVVILPGIPGELRRIVTESVEPTLLAGRGQPQHVAELTHGYPESALNVVFDRLVADFPDVHLGSYPGRVCTVRLKGGADRVEAAMALVRAELAALDAAAGSAALRAGWAARHEGS